MATVMNLLILVAGGASFLGLPLREYPDVDVPVVSVETRYPGASPETVEATVTEPLEELLYGIEGVRSTSSASTFGVSAINVEFYAGRDLDVASTDVSNAVQRGLGELPEEAERPVVAKTQANSFPVMLVQLSGEDFSPVDLTDIAERVVRPPLQVLPGVAQAMLGGERRYAMRVWLDPARMAARQVDAFDVRRAIQQSNLQLPAGELEAAARRFTINADAGLTSPEGYEAIVIREDGERPVRIGDVGWVELGSADYQTVTRQTGVPIVSVSVLKQSRSNEIAITRAVRALLPKIRLGLPEGVDLDVSVDFTLYVREALGQVWRTLAIASVVVVLVNLLFLHSPRATVITVVAIPVALVGTFAGLGLLGFSINILTLLALVLSIGLLADDSVVVMENIYRRQQLGEGPLLAARNGAREVGFPVLATTAAVIAVLIPLSLMTGETGRLFREFALTLATAVGISTFVALTLVPSLCALFLRVQRRSGGLGAGIERALRSSASLYQRALEAALRRRGVVGAGLAGVVLAIALLYTGLPQTFLPGEDRGRVYTFIRAPEGATSAYTRDVALEVEKRLFAVPEVKGFFAGVGMPVGGPASPSAAVVFSSLRHWSERTVKQQAIVKRLQGEYQRIPQALVFAVNPPSLSNRTTGDIDVLVKSSSASLDEFAAVVAPILSRLRERPSLVNVDSDLRLTNPELEVIFDREAAADLGVPISAVSESLRLLVSQGPADEFVLRNKQYDVIMALASPFRSVPDHLGEVHVRSRSGAMVPLSSLIETVPSVGPTALNHYDLQRSARITASLAEGAALGTELAAVQAVVDEEISARPDTGFTSMLAGASREFAESSTQVVLTFATAMLVIYLVLAAQFESFVHPLTVLASVPLAALGALLTLAALGMTLNLYSQIGMILLVGIVTKNAILLVDFANQERARGSAPLEALRAAGRTRFRPILMTSATSILGALPLALATGAAAESRQAIGAAIIGGLLFATVFTLVVIPVVHYALIWAAERVGLQTIPPRVEFDAAE
jgi:multidrug efflux pump